MYVWVEWVWDRKTERERERERQSERQRVGDGRDAHTLGWWCSSSVEPLCLVLYFREASTNPLQNTESSLRFSTFMSLVYLRFFSIAQPYAVWHKARAQTGMVFCSCLLRSYFSLWVKIIPTLYNHQPHTSNLCFVCEHVSCLACHVTDASFPLGKHLHPVNFRKPVIILLCYPGNLCSMSKGSSGQHLTESYQVFLCNTNNLHTIVWF